MEFICGLKTSLTIHHKKVLTEKLTTQIDQCEQIESENQDCDEAGICRTIDSITGSRKLRDGTRDQCEKFKSVQRDTNAILAQAKALIDDPKLGCPLFCKFRFWNICFFKLRFFEFTIFKIKVFEISKFYKTSWTTFPNST